MNVTLRQLRVFRAAAQELNFSRAGDAVGLTQPAVSRSILELEVQLGLKLLDRTTREVVLTEAGASLAARLDRVLDELDQTLQDVSGMASGRRGKVRVASSPTLSAHLMPACIAACTRREPDIELVLLDRVQQDVLDSVRGGEVDFGVVIEPSSADDLQAETILVDPFVLVVPADHALAGRQEVRWAELAERPLVLLDHSSGSRRLIDDALRAHGVVPRVAQQLGHPTTVFRMIEAGIGIGVMPALAAAPQALAPLRVLPLAPRVRRRVMLVHRRNRAPSPLAQRVWQLIAGVARAGAGTATA
ncbi:LysR family transcriptional regulator [Comamonadaceae bacterium OTU4NAUVB1]|jgi:DNA-binding transcriptional LysR family regulator|nr:LysR family transcriptional regulator [Comamonadaceae bacterium OTU4NAUVB1]HSU22431.1 LysR family transcriptional regulator [Variovorax sp.]